jgi:hypothetical protein
MVYTLALKEGRTVHTRSLVLVAVVLGLVTVGVCSVWQITSEETPTEAAQRTGRDLDAAIDSLASGDRPSAQSTAPEAPWPTAHPFLSGLLVFVATLIIGRLYLFMRRLEDR